MGFSTSAARPVVLFDLDGTLLPMDMKAFERAYFGGLCRTLTEYPPEDLGRWVWAGTKAMAMNDGSRPNREAFAEVFTRESGVDYFENEERFLDYYRTVFQQCRDVCPITDVSRRIVETLRQKGYRLWLLSNAQQVFTAYELRLVGLEAQFDGVYLSPTTAAVSRISAFSALCWRSKSWTPDAAS